MKDERNIVKFCVVAWAALTFVIAVSAQPVVGLIAWGGLSVTGGFLNVAVTTYQVRRVPGHMLGRVMAINRFLTSGAVPLGALTAGYIIAQFQPNGAAWLVFAPIAVLAVAVHPRKLLPGRVIDWLKSRLTPRTETRSGALEEIPADGRVKVPIP